MRMNRQTRGRSAPSRLVPQERPAGPITRVLVVGEDERFRQRARRRLRSIGFDDFTTDDGIDALSAAHSDPPDLIVLDHVIGWLDARYLLAQLRRDAHTAHIPILLVDELGVR